MKNSLKKSFLLSFLLLGIVMITSTLSFSQTNGRIRLVFGTRTHPTADGKGCEGDKGICFLVYTTANIGKSTEPNSGIGEVSLQDGKIIFNIVSDSSPAQTDENTFYVYQDMKIPAEAAREFGFNSIIIKRGQYTLDKTKNRLGQVALPIITQ
jgi:hypothetical protein